MIRRGEAMTKSRNGPAMECRHAFASLERRLLLVAAGAAGFEQSNLLVRGTKGDDLIELQRDPSAKRLLVTIDGKAFHFDLKTVTRVLVDGGRGRDRIVDHGGWNRRQTVEGVVDENHDKQPVIDLSGGADDDVIESNSWSNQTPVLLEGGSGNDVLRSHGNGRFKLSGGGDDDRLFGSDGPDSLIGDGGDDVLYAGAGNDSLYGGLGSDFIEGEAGQDLWSQDPVSPAYTELFPNAMRLTFDRKANDGPTGENDNVRSVEVIATSQGADTIDASNADAGISLAFQFVSVRGPDSIIGSQFDDHLILRGPATIRGGAGNDTIQASGTSWLYGDDGNDSLGVDDDNPPSIGGRIDGGRGNDLLTGNKAPNDIDGGPGNDTINSSGGQDTLVGYSGDDLITVDDYYLFDVRQPGPRGVDVRGGSGRDTLDQRSLLDLTDGPPSGFEFTR